MSSIARGVIETPAYRQRRIIRHVAAAISGLTALLYLLIGLEVLQVVEATTEEAPGMLEFGVMAGTAFLFGAVLLVATDRRILWALGALFQIGVIVMYVVVGPQRSPSFEVWGLTIKALQLVLLAALVYLAVRPVGSAAAHSG
jgi:hypothetical protein